MALEIQLSGHIGARVAGHRIDLGPPQTRICFAALAWDADRTVSIDTLIHRIWDDDLPVKPRPALHAHVSRIRRALRAAGRDAPSIVSRTNSYVMHVDPDLVDLRCYTNCVNQGRSLYESGEAEEALRLLERADGLWRGEPLAGIAGSWAEHLRATVGETSLAAAMTRAEILMGFERFTDAVPVLRPLAEEHPVDEALAERLAIALYGSSRTAEATKLLQRTRQRVIRDIGLDAGRRLHRVQEGILSGTPATELLGHGRAQAAPARPAGRVPDNLPRDVPWVGRQDEVRRLAAALGEGGGPSNVVVTVEAIDGMGGVGKTSLAVHVGHQLRDRFPAGRLFVHLGGHGADRTPPESARVLAELLRLLGTDAKELPQETSELVALWRETARDRRMLVILDDAADSAQVRDLLPGASPTAVIVTSRRRLPGLPGVRTLSLDVLSPDDAVALFAQRLGPRHGTQEAEIAAIVRICDYLPLAVEIAASRLLARPSWTTADLLRRLGGAGGHLAELRDGERTVTRVFEDSYRALTAEQQLVFRRVGLHRGVEFGPPAVAALTGLSTDSAERVLEELMAQSLLSEPKPNRFTMHDLLREYARTLIDSGDSDSAEDARRAVHNMVEHYVAVADRADRLAYPFRARIDLEVFGGPGGSGLGGSAGPAVPEMADAQAAERWLVGEAGNLLDVLSWLADHGTERQLALAVHVLAEFLAKEGHRATLEPLLQRAVAHWTEGHGAARAHALLDLSILHTQGSRFEEGITAAREAMDAARLLEAPELEAICIHNLSNPLWQTGQYALVRSVQKRSLELLTQTGSKLQIARCRSMLGIAHYHLAEYDEARACFQAALSAFFELADSKGKFIVLNNLAQLSEKTGDLAAAERAYQQAMQLPEIVASRREHSILRMNLASVLDALGKAEEALTVYGTVLPVLREAGDRRSEAIALNRIGRAYRATGRSEQALARHTAALALARRIHADGEVVDALYDLAQAERDTGRLSQAMTHYEQSRVASARLGAPAEEARAARALAELRGMLGKSIAFDH